LNSRFSRRFLASVVAALLLASAVRLAADVIVARNTRHLSFTAAITPDVVKPNSRLQLIVNVTPKKGVHVYAPGATYRAITVTLDRNPALKPSKAVYPQPSIYIFKPLKEQVLVYSDPFKLSMNVVVGTIPARTARLRITGSLSYQACDDRVCYLPESVPLEWNLAVAR
jgi:DsbC/DsbD-like thiol-disulfide interchange protein